MVLPIIFHITKECRHGILLSYEQIKHISKVDQIVLKPNYRIVKKNNSMRTIIMVHSSAEQQDSVTMFSSTTIRYFSKF